MRPRSRTSSGRRAGGAAQLARCVLEWVDDGFDRRAHGRCGVPPGAERRHRIGGHDAGCAALGVPRHELTRMIEQADTSGAASLIGDAVDQAIAELGRRGAAWRVDTARDAVVAAIERRITPAPARSSRVRAPMSRATFDSNSEEPRPSQVMSAAPRPQHG